MLRPHRHATWLSSIGLVLVVGCGSDASAADELPGAHFRFVDVAAEARIDVVCVSGDPRRWYIPEGNGCGAAWLDHDGDGDMDLFVANGAGMRYVDDGARLEVVRRASSRLYRNDGGLAFTDVSEEAGAKLTSWINAVATGDVDADGDTDLYLACFGADVLLVNEGGRFVDGTAAAGLDNDLWGAGAVFGDVDNDGDLDLYVANYVAFDLDAPPEGGRRAVYDGVEVSFGPEGEAGPGINPGAPDRFWRNDGRGRFTEATEAAGFALDPPLCSYACVFADVDRDGWIDLLVANDLQPCNLFLNRGDGTFTERGVASGFALDALGEPTSAMGLFVRDVDGDGDQDVLRTNFDLEPNSLHLGDGAGRFVERAAAHGLADPSFDRLGWGGDFLDADLDGDQDLLIANGHVMPQAAEIGMSGWEMRSQLFEALPHPELGIVWRDVTAAAGPGLLPKRSSRGVALGDPDDDGDLDALIVDIDHAPRLLRNDTQRRGRWLAVRLLGDPEKGGNRDGYGAVLTVHAGGRTWTREVRTSGGLYSAHDPRTHFGLGPVEAIERVEVRWPGGATQTVDSPAIDQLLTIRQTTPR